MLHYCLAHLAYHCSRWLPKPHRFRLQLVILVFGLSILFLQFYVLLRPKSSRYCNQPLLYNLVGSIALTFFAIGLSLVLVVADHLPWQLRTSFFIFGFTSFAEGVCTTLLTALATQCAKTTPELYYFSVTLSIASIVSTTYFSFLGLFWLANVFTSGLILNKKAKTGICYEPVSECSCLWHV